jgi:hypothetical protein
MIASWSCAVLAQDQPKAEPSPASPAATAPADKVVADFEDGPQGWEGTGGGKVSVSDEHPTLGAKSLKAELPVGDYPGIGIEFKGKQDWSDAQALRFSVFNASRNALTMCVRIDDAGSKGFPTRYNGDMYPFKLGGGANEVEVTMAALRVGGFMCRGLDVDRIKVIRFFCGGLKQPVTLYFDNIRLVCRKPSGPDSLALSGANAAAGAKWTAGDGAKVDQAGKDLKVQLTPEGGEYPRLGLTGMPGDWLTYDLLSVDIDCPKDSPSPRSIAVKLIDSAGRSQTCSVPLDKGANKVCLPLEIFAEVGLGKINELSLFASAPQVKEEMTIANVVLQRSNVVEFPAVRDAKAEDAALTLDMTGLKVPRNTSFLAGVYIPLTGGKTRLVRCNSAWVQPNRGELKYALPAGAFEGCDKEQPVRIWVFVSDHGVWSYWFKSAKYEGKPLTVPFIGGQG